MGEFLLNTTKPFLRKLWFFFEGLLFCLTPNQSELLHQNTCSFMGFQNIYFNSPSIETIIRRQGWQRVKRKTPSTAYYPECQECILMRFSVCQIAYYTAWHISLLNVFLFVFTYLVNIITTKSSILYSSIPIEIPCSSINMLTCAKVYVSVFSWGNKQWSSVVKKRVRLVDKNSIHLCWLCRLDWAKGCPGGW